MKKRMKLFYLSKNKIKSANLKQALKIDYHSTIDSTINI